MSVASFLFSQAKQKQKLEEDNYLKVDLADHFSLSKENENFYESNEGKVIHKGFSLLY